MKEEVRGDGLYSGSEGGAYATDATEPTIHSSCGLCRSNVWLHVLGAAGVGLTQKLKLALEGDAFDLTVQKPLVTKFWEVNEPDPCTVYRPRTGALETV